MEGTRAYPEARRPYFPPRGPKVDLGVRDDPTPLGGHWWTLSWGLMIFAGAASPTRFASGRAPSRTARRRRWSMRERCSRPGPGPHRPLPGPCPLRCRLADPEGDAVTPRASSTSRRTTADKRRPDRARTARPPDCAARPPARTRDHRRALPEQPTRPRPPGTRRPTTRHPPRAATRRAPPPAARRHPARATRPPRHPLRDQPGARRVCQNRSEASTWMRTGRGDLRALRTPAASCSACATAAARARGARTR